MEEEDLQVAIGDLVCYLDSIVNYPMALIQ